MPVKRKFVVATATAALLAGGTATAFAVGGDGDDGRTDSGARPVQSATQPVPRTQVNAEEAAAALADRGRVTAVELDKESGKAMWEVETTTSAGERDWKVDGSTGKVTADTDDDRDDADDDRDNVRGGDRDDDKADRDDDRGDDKD